MANFASGRLLLAFIVVLVICIEIKTYRWWSSEEQTSAVVAGSGARINLGWGKKQSVQRKRILVASSFGAHDVFMSLVDTLESLLLPLPNLPNGSTPSSPVRVYTPGLRYELGTQVLSELEIYSSPYYSPAQLFEDVDAAWDGLGAEVVILGTCEVDMGSFSDGLWKIWQSRPDDRKFPLVCITHNTNDFNWAERYSGDWARVGQLRVMPISPHAAHSQYNRFVQFSDASNRFHLGYSQISVHPHIPILPIERLRGFNAHGEHSESYIFSPEQDGLGELRLKFKDINDEVGGVRDEGLDSTWGRRDGRVLRDVVIQGNFEAFRRNYVGIFADLEAEIALDPSSWGYLAPSSPSSPFVPAATRDHFVLHLAGNGDPDFIPPRLAQYVVKVHRGLSYPDFFSLMGSMDVVLPAFTDSGGYYEFAASLTVAMAMQCEVPLLVTARIFRAYAYLTPDTTILRPHTVSEVQALKILRTSHYSRPARGYLHTAERSYTETDAGLGRLGVVASEGELLEHASVRADAEEMIKRGWTTNEKVWKKFKKGIREMNQAAVREMVLER